ncbi:hypothetical protein DXV75_03790 [Alteromonas aestuariivivens]|uniref:Spondin domain-containing protein n=1 Tax=Alteromonas aestuariivivens TaxID=1938339 RepID=A0A3D8MC76_9ALTE|nr:spondin domain-containing protein [Alteromonas aestuariivivens]RDV28096.1 hypothetical protein DXV75_03790 [Alteromonas aestuariivivens]
MRIYALSSLAAILATVPFCSVAAELDIEIQNLTHGIYFTPLLVAAHSNEASLFEVGESASPELQSMAEGGDISGLVMTAQMVGADMLQNPAGGLLEPTKTASASLSTSDGNTVLSLVAMLLPTNDGFVGLDNWPIPSEPGTYVVYLNGYDAGTEANDEIRGNGMPGMAGMPVPEPLEELVGMNGSGVASSVTNASVHVHPGNIGDNDQNGGISDISNLTQRWLNPVARLTVTVSE